MCARWTKEEYIAAGSPRVNPHEKKEYLPEYCEIAQNLSASGANQKDLAFHFGTSQDVIREWKKTYPEFKNAINRGKEVILQRLIGAGIRSAEGMTVTTITTTGKGVVSADGTVKELIPGTVVDVKKEVKQIPPNDKSLQFLANTISRQLGSDAWITKNFSETKISGEVKHKLDSSAIQQQIESQSAQLLKAVDAEVTDASYVDGDEN